MGFVKFFLVVSRTIVQQIIWIDCQIDSFENRAKRYQKCTILKKIFKYSSI